MTGGRPSPLFLTGTDADFAVDTRAIDTGTQTIRIEIPDDMLDRTTTEAIEWASREIRQILLRRRRVLAAAPDWRWDLAGAAPAVVTTVATRATTANLQRQPISSHKSDCATCERIESLPAEWSARAVARELGGGMSGDRVARHRNSRKAEREQQ